MANATTSFGASSRQVKTVTALPEFDRETKMIRRCMALCEIKHCIGDYFALDFTFPSPCIMTAEYTNLMAHPGVVKVTTDEAPNGKYGTFRHVVITNIPWLIQLTRDSPNAATIPTLSLD